MTIKDYAFPDPSPADNCAPGLTKREYIAAKAIQGILANPENSGSFEAFADDAMEYADALLAALAKPKRAEPDNDCGEPRTAEEEEQARAAGDLDDSEG